MRLLRDVDARIATTLSAGTVATIGNFDGVHCGHQALLAALKQAAQRQNLPTLVILFEPQPHEYFKGALNSVRLTRFKKKWQILKQCKIDYVCCLRFNLKLASMPADVFAKQLIFSKLSVKTLLIGEDFRFGAGRTGDIALLTRAAAQAGAVLQVYPEVVSDSLRISSTRIRELLQSGDVRAAATLLGRAYSLEGHVMRGKQLGRTFGVPTANIALKRSALPMSGVFCVQVRRANGRVYDGVANIGRRPTVDGFSHSLEVHLFDFEGDLYHEALTVFFLHQLRDEVKFPSLEALIAQIKADIVDARALKPRLIEAFPVRIIS